ncbi:MAG: carboxymuconolactone decarboxylase family protein [Gemmatimonadetes bacterium]|nr:carboxymuconolactone decarboxylase family protein [Gemmatimonadota bacterium]
MAGDESEEMPEREDLRRLAALAAAVAAGDDAEVTSLGMRLAGRVPRRSAEEAVLQTYLFAGFPAAINGFMALELGWARGGDAGHGQPPAERDGDAWQGRQEPASSAACCLDDWRARGEELCRRVYGPDYERLRRRMHALNPALDERMIVEGYGRTLSRPGIPASARELCAVAALAARGAERQLAAHLAGARRLGVDESLLREVARESVERYAPERMQARLLALLAPGPAAGGDGPPA